MRVPLYLSVYNGIIQQGIYLSYSTSPSMTVWTRHLRLGFCLFNSLVTHNFSQVYILLIFGFRIKYFSTDTLASFYNWTEYHPPCHDKRILCSIYIYIFKHLSEVKINMFFSVWRPQCLSFPPELQANELCQKLGSVVSGNLFDFFGFGRKFEIGLLFVKW